MTTPNERIAALETSSKYHKEDLDSIMIKLDSIEKKIEGLNSFKFQLVGVSSVFAVIISFICSFIQAGIFNK